jgi:hypothetical protein
MSQIKLKKCTFCHKYKELDEFCKRSAVKSGYTAHCKKCHNIKYPTKKYNCKVSKKNKFYYRRYYNENKLKLRESSRIYYHTHRKYQMKEKMLADAQYKAQITKYRTAYSKYIKRGSYKKLKYCPICNDYKPKHEDFFLIQRGSHDGFFGLCKECSKYEKRMRAYRLHEDESRRTAMELAC